MKRILILAPALVVGIGLVSGWAAQTGGASGPKPLSGKGLRPALLRCEYLEEPLGIQDEAPRLSWIVESSERGQSQTAYQVLVASTEDVLEHEKGDLWDSEKVQSDDTIAVVYAGKALN